MVAAALVGDLHQLLAPGEKPEAPDHDVASEMGRADALRDALRRMVVASVGPIITEALEAHGIKPDLEPEHPKMGHLLAAVARQAADLLRRKRGGE